MTNAIEVIETEKAVRRFRGREGSELHGARGRNFWPARAERRGKNHVDSHDDDADAADFRNGVVGGHDVVTDADGVRHAIGVIPQALTSDPELTARENMMIHAKLYGLTARPARRSDSAIAGIRGT